MPKAFTLGLSLSVVGIIVLALIIIFEKKINKLATRILCPIVIPTNGIEPENFYSDDDDENHGDGTTDITLQCADPVDRSNLENAERIDGFDNDNGGK